MQNNAIQRSFEEKGYLEDECGTNFELLLLFPITLG